MQLRLGDAEINGKQDPYVHTVLGNPKGNFKKRIAFTATSDKLSILCYPRDDDYILVENVYFPSPQFNISVKQPTILSNGDVLLTYNVENKDFKPAAGNSLKLELAVHNNNPSYNYVIYSREITQFYAGDGVFRRERGDSDNFKVGQHTFRIPREIIANYVQKYDVLKTFVNRPFQGLEPNSSDNEASTTLVSLGINKLDFDGKGGIVFRVDGSKYGSEALKEIPIKIIWTKGANLEDWRDGFISEIASMNCPNGSDVTLKKQQITVPFDNDENLGVRIVLDPDNKIFQRVENKSDKILKIPRLSFELATAPIARTAEERVKLWLKPHQKLIIDLSIKYNIDPRSITGVIAWEAMKNIDSTQSFKTYFRGPGKLHTIYEGIDFQAIREGWTDIATEAEEDGFVIPKMPDANFRMDEILIPEGAIRYIAGIMADLSAQGEVYVQDGKPMFIRNRPDVLAAWYQGFRPSNADSSLPRGIKGIGKFFANANSTGLKYVPNIPEKRSMGYWIQSNMKLVNSLLSATYNPKRRNRVVPQPNKDTYYIPKKTKAKLAVLVNDGDLNNKPRGLFSVTTPKNGIATIEDNTIIYTPRADFKGRDTFSYMSYDDEGVIVGEDVEVNVEEPVPNLPGSVSVSAVSQTTAKLRWQDLSDNEDRFVIETRKTGGSWGFQENVPANTTEATITGLTPGQAYEARVKAVNVDGGYSISGAVAFNTKIEMRVPSSIKVIALSPTELAIDWNFNDPNAHRLQLMYRIPGTQDWAYMSDPGISDGGVEIQGLLANTTYEFRLRTVYKKSDGSEDASPWSETVSLTTPEFTAVKSASASAISSTEIIVQFGFDGSGHNRFQLQRLDVATGNWIYLSDLAPGERSFKDTGLQANKEYRYRTRAIYPGEQTSSWKQTEIVRTQQLPPQPLAAPQSLATTAIYATDIQLGWSHNLTDGQFIVEQSTSYGTWFAAKYLDARSRAANMSSLQPNTNYRFAIRFLAPDGRLSEPSNIIETYTLLNVVETPSGLRTNVPGPNSVRLEFDYRSNASNFIIEKWSAAQGWHRLITISGTQKFYDATGLNPSTDYQFAVRAIMPNGQISDHSNVVLITTSSGVPASPNDLHRGTVGKDYFDIIWNDNANNETHYKVLVKPEGGSFNLSENVAANTNKARIEYVKQGGSRLKPNTLYTVRVTATNGYGDSAYDEVQIRTKAE